MAGGGGGVAAEGEGSACFRLWHLLEQSERWTQCPRHHCEHTARCQVQKVCWCEVGEVVCWCEVWEVVCCVGGVLCPHGPSMVLHVGQLPSVL